MTARPMHELLAIAVVEARELVADGAADDITMDQVELAQGALAHTWDAPRTVAEIDALAVVAGLAVEYLANVDRVDDVDAADLLQGLGDEFETADAAVRAFYRSLAAAR